MVEQEKHECPYCDGKHPAVYLDIVFDGPPEHVSGRFVEVENQRGESVTCGEWIEDGDLWRLRISPLGYYHALA